MKFLMARPYLLNALLLCVALLLSVAVGVVYIPVVDIARYILDAISFQTDPGVLTDTMATIVLQLRLPHTILIALAGAALAASGAAYQGLFQNPLADPYLIGVASGAGLGAVLAMSINWPSNLLGFFTIPVAAFVGGSITVILVYSLARFGNVLSTTNLILAGVAVGSFASALTSFIMLRSEGEVRRAIAWLLGGSTLSGWAPVLASLPYIIICMGLLLASGHALNVLQFGDEQAQQLGLPVERVKILVILAASLATATAVSFTGVIGFIGLIVPHLIRLLWGPDYRNLLPLSILGGASALLIADLLARTLIAPQEIPVGVITALAGAPFFLWVLRRSQRGTIQV
jgi:iron complex transport system permease protein